MQKQVTVFLLMLASWIGTPPKASAQPLPPTRTLYQITAGAYTMVGGIWGTLTQNLPNAEQAFVRLTIEPQNFRAELTLLAQDQQTIFLALTNGLVSGTVILFHYPVAHAYSDVGAPGTLDYTVTNIAGDLSIEGNIEFPPICCDIPHLFSHQNVTAIPIVSPGIQVSEVETSPGIRVTQVQLSWTATTNRTYQIQYCSDLKPSTWMNMGDPITGSGASCCTLDRVPLGEPGRFYRVLTLP